MDKNNIFIKQTETVKDALKKLDKSSEKILLVVNDKNQLSGTLTDGDIRRCILKGCDLDTDLSGKYCDHPTTMYIDEYSPEEAKKLLLNKRIEVIPLLDKNKVVIEYVTWEQLFSEEKKFISNRRIPEIPVVIMAGGKGTRLAPFTNVLPKPLIPIKEKTISEWIIESFSNFGINRYFFTLNYKSAMIKAYYDSIDKDYSLEYIEESEFYGTAGSLKLIENVIDSTFIVSNCDIIVKADYAEVIEYHKSNKALITVLSSIHHHTVPYGVVNFKNGGEIINIKEKPEFTFTINTGVYVLEHECLEYIPNNTMFHMTDLIEVLIKNKKKIITYPVNEKEYIDIGQWEEYQQAVEKFKF